MKHFPEMLFIVPAAVILLLAIGFGEKRERKAPWVVLVAVAYICLRVLMRKWLHGSI